MNFRMIERTPIRDHMIALYNEIEILGDEIDEEMLVNMILEVLPDSFKQFKLNYTMNKLMMNLPKLMSEFHMVEGILKDAKGVHMEVKDSSSFSYNNNKNTFKKTKYEKTKARKGKTKEKDKCFISGKIRHWKKECLDYHKKVEDMLHSLLVK